MNWIENNLLMLIVGTVVSWIIAIVILVGAKVAADSTRQTDSWTRVLTNCFAAIIGLAFWAAAIGGVISCVISIVLKIITHTR